MNDLAVFDVLVVYAGRLVRSAFSRAKVPFDPAGEHANRNMSYAYVLDEAKRQGLRMAFASSDDVSDPGTCSSYWTHDATGWHKHTVECFAPHIFDKCAPINKTQRAARTLLFANEDVRPFTNKKLVNLFLDKQATYERLPHMTIPTVTVRGTRLPSAQNAIEKLQTLIANAPVPEDFGSEFILKDRLGAGGEDIYRIPSENAAAQISKLVTEHPDVSFILQPFVNFQHGFSLTSEHRATDIRIIYMGSERVHAYTRTAKKGDFRCNMHQGGSIEYIDWEQLPEQLLADADETAQKLQVPHSLYAIDFIVADSGATYLLEGNTTPGIDWYPGNAEDEANAHELIAVIIKELKRRVSVQDKKLGYTRIQTPQIGKDLYARRAST